MLQASITKAVKISPDRLEVRRTARSLDSEINRLKVKITTQQEQQGDREEVVRYPTQTSAYYLCPVVSWCDVHMQISSGTRLSWFLPHSGSITRLWRTSRTWHNKWRTSTASLNAWIKSWTRGSRFTLSFAGKLFCGPVPNLCLCEFALYTLIWFDWA